jgi:hypothetical protein
VSVSAYTSDTKGRHGLAADPNLGGFRPADVDCEANFAALSDLTVKTVSVLTRSVFVQARISPSSVPAMAWESPSKPNRLILQS